MVQFKQLSMDRIDTQRLISDHATQLSGGGYKTLKAAGVEVLCHV